MKKKGIVKWILLLAAVAVLILVLTMCTKSRGTEAEEALPALAAETAASAVETEQTEATTEPSQETTAPIEETTEPTEETTEPTEEVTEPEEEEPEETTAPTTGSGSTDSDDKEEDYGDEEPYWEGPDPGTPENPFLEVLTEYPAEVKSVNIPRGAKVSYVIDGSAGAVITVREPGVTLTVDGTSYTADEATGEITVDLSKLGKDPVITLAHSGTTAASCTLNLSEGLGGAGNPEVLTDPQEVEIRLPEGDDDGYHYQWISDVTGKVELTLKEEETVPGETEAVPEETPGEEETQPVEEPVLEVIVTIGEQVIRLSECEDGKISFDTVQEQDIRIQVIAQPFTDGSYPAIEEILVWNRIYALGTEENPELLEFGKPISVNLEEGERFGRWFQWTADTYGTLTLSADAQKLALAVKAGETVTESTDGSVTVPVEKDQQILIHAVAVPDEAGNYPAVVNQTVTAAVKAEDGTPENPAVLESLENAVIELKENDHDGFTGTWTAACDGTLELTAAVDGAAADVLILSQSETVSRLSEMPEGKLTAELEAGQSITLQMIAVPDENGAYGASNVTLNGSFMAVNGSSPEVPITISSGETEMTVALGERQTLYFAGMVHEMVMTVEDAAGVSIRCGEDTVWVPYSGETAMTFPAAEEQEPVTFSVTSKNAVEVTLSFAYPEGHEQNPAELAMGSTTVTLEEKDTDGYIFDWTAECDGLLTVGVSGKSGWQYQLDTLAPEAIGERFTSEQEVPVPTQTRDVKAGEQLRLTLWTLPTTEGGDLPAGTLTVEASFVDPLLGTEEKPVRLETDSDNKITVPAGESIYYAAEAEGMRLHIAGGDVTLTYAGTDYSTAEGVPELVCQEVESIFRITNSSEKEQSCTLRFEYPLGHTENPAALVMGDNTAVLEEGSISGYSFRWTAEGTGFLTVTMPQDSGWQYLICNKTAGICGVIHTSEDQPVLTAETVEVTKGDEIRVVVNTFDQEHPLDAPAGEILFTAEFVDPTLGMEENPVWLNQEDTVSIPAGKTMYCTAKADGMILTLEGEAVTVVHNEQTHTPKDGIVRFLCAGTGTFGHPVFAVTNTGAEDREYTVSFSYPEGHFLNPMELELKEQSVVPGKNGQYFLWKAEADGMFTFTINSESGWWYMITNVTASETGEQYHASEEEPVFSQTLAVKAGDEIRIVVNTEEEGSGEEILFEASFEPGETVTLEE